MADIPEAVRRIDAYQQRHEWLAFPVAVVRKFQDDHAGYLSTLVAYYAFFSLFPLLLVLVSVLGFILGNNSDLREQIITALLTQIPVIGNQVNKSISEIRGSGVALGLGVAGTLLAGTSVIRALQHGMNEVWGVPDHHRPNVLVSRLQALAFLALLGTGVVASTFVAGIGGTSGGFLPLGLRVGGVATSVALNFGMFLVAFRFLTTAPITVGQVWPGAVVAACGWAAMQTLGGFVIRTLLPRATVLYGFFAIVLGLMAWLFVGSNITLLAAEVNVVRSRRLWPAPIDQSTEPAPDDEIGTSAGENRAD
ncbi:MAG TPA: YihY/virulence factor BrkB family protein [Actinomycetota bacterium]|nr:YihY/virulence factor BrkB family protein [Actinomycetota bacterium]